LAFILILTLIVRAALGSPSGSPKPQPQLAESLTQANELWLKSDAQHGIPKYESLVPQVEKAFGRDSPMLSLIFFRLGSLYYNRGDPWRAISDLEKCLKLVGPLPDAKNLVNKSDLYFGLGMSYRAIIQIEPAIRAFNECLKRQEKLLGPDNPSLAQILGAIAELHSWKEQFSDAIPLLERALAISEKKFGIESKEAATALASLGNTRAQADQFEPALACLKRSLQIRERLLPPSHPDVAIALFNLGALYQTHTDYQLALPLLERSVELLEKIFKASDPNSGFQFRTSATQFATALQFLGRAQGENGDYHKAVGTSQQSVAVIESAWGGASPNLVNPLVDLGQLYFEYGYFERARQSFERALRILEDAPVPKIRDRISTIHSLARTLVAMGDENGALQLFSQAQKMAEEHYGVDDLSVGYTLNGLALISQRRGDAREALRLFGRALAIFRKKLGDSHPNVARVLNYIGAIYEDLGYTNTALTTFQQALAIQEKVLPPNHVDLGGTYYKLASLYRKRRDFKQAETLFRRSIAINDATRGPDDPESCRRLEDLGITEFLSGDQPKGLGEFVAAAKRRRRYLASQTIVQQSVGDSYDNLYGLQSWFHSLCGIAQSNFNAPYALADPKAASAAGAEQLAFSKALLEEVDTIKARLAVDGGPAVQSLQEKADLIHRRLESLSRLEGQKYEEYIKERMDWRNSERDKLEHDFATTEASLVGANELVANAIREQNLSLAEIAGRLPADAVLVDLVQYQRTDVVRKQLKEQRYAAYLTFPFPHHSFVERVDLGEAAPIDEAIGVIAKRFAAGQYAAKDLPPVFQRLSELVYAPLANYLRDTKHLIICPDGQLDRVPFEMLPVGNKFLLEEKTISYVTSAREIIRLAAAQSKPKSKSVKAAFLVMGNPDFDLDLAKSKASFPNLAVQRTDATTQLRSLSRDYGGLKFNPLPGAETEACDVAKLLGVDGELRLGAEAREAELKAVRSPNVLYLATHGFFLSDQEFKQINFAQGSLGSVEHRSDSGKPSGDWENPMVRCGIALSGANHAQQITDPMAENGLLTGLEASLLDLQGTQLVVLSACDSGSGEVKIGEGVMSLCRGFRIAGAQTVLASHWAVSDKATTEMMTEFMRRWHSGEQRADAWREAQLMLLHSKDFSDPFFWSAFTLTGQWQ
jgi:CHAT domain-containing protein/tetratricopeptide (TPR) repeat protein